MQLFSREGFCPGHNRHYLNHAVTLPVFKLVLAKPWDLCLKWLPSSRPLYNLFLSHLILFLCLSCLTGYKPLHNLEILINPLEVGNCHFHCVNVSNYEQLKLFWCFWRKCLLYPFTFLSLISRQLEKYITMKGCAEDSCFIFFSVWLGRGEDAAKPSSSIVMFCIFLN